MIIIVRVIIYSGKKRRFLKGLETDRVRMCAHCEIADNPGLIPSICDGGATPLGGCDTRKYHRAQSARGPLIFAMGPPNTPMANPVQMSPDTCIDRYN